MEKFIISPSLRVGFAHDTLRFGFGSPGQHICHPELQDALLDSALFFKHPHTLHELNAHLQGKGYCNATTSTAEKVLGSAFLIPSKQYRPLDRHSRSHLFYSLSKANAKQVQNTLANIHVAIIGCGGIGNLISATLATAGIGQLTLFDHDTIELSNLSRQILFTEADCTKPKATCLSQALQQRSHKTKINVIDERATKLSLDRVKTCDLLLVSGDEPGLVDTVNEFSLRHNIPYLNAGYVEDVAVWGPLVNPGKSGCFHCQSRLATTKGLTPDQEEKCQRINKTYQAPSCGPINMMASSFASLDILKFLGKFGTVHSLNTRIGIWSHNLTIERQDFSLNPRCPSCAHLQPTHAKSP